MDISSNYILLKAELLSTDNKNPNEVFLFNSSTNRGFLVEGIAAQLCKKMDGKKTFDELIKEFESEHNTSVKKFEKDIEKFVSDLIQNDLISVSEKTLP